MWIRWYYQHRTFGWHIFSTSNQTQICSLNQEDRESYEIFLSLTNIILNVAQSVNASKNVRTDKLKALGIELILHLKTSFLNEKGSSWVMIIPSFHQMCGNFLSGTVVIPLRSGVRALLKVGTSTFVHFEVVQLQDLDNSLWRTTSTTSFKECWSCPTLKSHQNAPVQVAQFAEKWVILRGPGNIKCS